ncbi:CPSF4 factor, partial [Rhynochetos jubatus]|nr:CPSF4 factor [Rhynochetos jubatus]
MQELVTGVERISFDSEAGVGQQRGALPFPGMGSKLGTGPCGILGGGCVPRAGMPCPLWHVGREKTVVCQHWLHGLCKKGNRFCMNPVVPCFAPAGDFSNKDCPFLHVDVTTSTVGCPWYDRGFCRHGPLCRYKHTQRVMCANYLVGFCPEGPKCKFMQYVWGRLRGGAT